MTIDGLTLEPWANQQCSPETQTDDRRATFLLDRALNPKLSLTNELRVGAHTAPDRRRSANHRCESLGGGR